MTSKERMLCALDRGKPDRLPISAHQWQGYHSMADHFFETPPEKFEMLARAANECTY